MLNFIFQNPTKIYFGKGQIPKLKEALPQNKKILLAYGKGSIKSNGVYLQVLDAIKDCNCDVIEFGGIEPNPSYETLMPAVDLVREKNIDFILAVGGGSVIDGVKFISAAVHFKGEPWDILTDSKAKISKVIPFGTVLTLPGTGSEMNSGAVISRRATVDKLGFIHPLGFPQFSILDPTTTFSLPPNQTANGIGDAFAHVIEQYITYPVDSPLQDRLAESLILTFMEEAPKVFSNPHDYNARANIMWCATMALNNILSCGVPEDWASHLIGHVLTAKYGLDHAKTLTVVLPNLLRVRKAQKKAKLLQYAQRVWGIADGSDDERIEKAITKTEKFFHSINLKTKLGDYGIGEEAIPFALAKYKDYGMTAIGEDGGVTLEVIREVLQRSL